MNGEQEQLKDMHKTSTVIFLFFSIICTELYGEEKKRIAFLDFTANNISESYARVVRNKIEKVFLNTNKFHILEKKRVKIVMNEKDYGDENCLEARCAITIGKHIFADYIVAGSIDVENNYTVIIRIFDITSSKILYVYSETYESKEKILKNSSYIEEISAQFIDVATSNNKIKKAKDISKDISIPDENIQAVEKTIALQGRSSNFFYLSPGIGYILPIGDFIYEDHSSYDFSFQMGINNVFINNLFISLGSGYCEFPRISKHLISSYSFALSITYITMSTGYSYSIFDTIFISPFVSFGGGYVDIGTNIFYKSGFQPILKAGLHLAYAFNSSSRVFTGTTSNIIFVRDVVINYLSFEAGMKRFF
ncbi:MAG: hypothetical protein GY754_06505 [bacterium]|nr:hypothetical protein [bacterium]